MMAERMDTIKGAYAEMLNVSAGYNVAAKRELNKQLAAKEKALGIDYKAVDESNLKILAEHSSEIAELTYNVLDKTTDEYFKVGGPAASAGRSMIMRSLGVNAARISDDVRGQIETGNLDAGGDVGESVAGRAAQTMTNSVYQDLDDQYSAVWTSLPTDVRGNNQPADLARRDVRKIQEERRKRIEGFMGKSGLEEKVNKP
jgi:hypothetical protein